MPLVDLTIQDIANKLQETYNDSLLSEQYAWWILEALTGKNKADLIAKKSLELTLEQQIILTKWLKKLIDEQYPLQYLLGYVPFNNVEILVKPPVLIPRPETEEWTVHIIQKLKKLKNTSITVLDLCTGSGCIAIAIAKELPSTHVFASDIQDHALQLAEKNCFHNKALNMTIIKSNLFDSIPQDLKFDLIVSNPPYITQEEWLNLEPSVKNWEDKRALVAQEDGLGIIAHIIKQAPKFLKPNNELELFNIPQVIIEIGYKQADSVKDLFEKSGYCHVEIEKDLEGKNRIACGRVVPCGFINKQ